MSTDLHTMRSFVTDEGIVIVAIAPTSDVVYHPVGEGLPPCKSEWKEFAAGGRRVEGLATLICKHGRMFVSPTFPIGFVTVLLHEHRVKLQAEQEAWASTSPPADPPPVLDFLAARRQKGTPPTTP